MAHETDYSESRSAAEMEAFTQVVLAGDKADRRRKRDGTQRIHLYVRSREVPTDTTPVMPPSTKDPRSAAELRYEFFKRNPLLLRPCQLRWCLYMPLRPSRQNYWRPPRKCCDVHEDKRVDSLLTEQIINSQTARVSSTVDKTDSTLLITLPCAITREFGRCMPTSLDLNSSSSMKSAHLSSFLAENVFTFDMRLQGSIQAFHRWMHVVGEDASCIGGLVLKHWTSYWAYGANKWAHEADETRFFRDIGGELILSRRVQTSQ
ncbi:hypothetical protein LTR95_000803 [Oleoguttula sp. CCFEE 5521]